MPSSLSCDRRPCSSKRLLAIRKLAIAAVCTRIGFEGQDNPKCLTPRVFVPGRVEGLYPSQRPRSLRPLSRNAGQQVPLAIQSDRLGRRNVSEIFLQESHDCNTTDKLQMPVAGNVYKMYNKTNSFDVFSKGKLDTTLAILVLGLVTVLWGAQHVVIKATLSGGDRLEVAALNFLRFGVAAICFSPWLPPGFFSQRRGVRASLEWRGGIELGFWLFLGFCLQAVGLLYTTAQRSSLLLYLNVKLVPFFAFFIFQREVSLSAWLLAAAALLGTFLVAGDGSAGVPLNIGDFLSLAAAAASAMFILRLEVFAPATDPKSLNAVGMLAVCVLCVPWLLTEATLAAPEVTAGAHASLGANVGSEVVGSLKSLVLDHLPAIFYLGVVTTAFTNWLQTIGQQSVPATTASVIYALDPLWGCLFAYIFLGESLGPQGIAGCGLLGSVWLYQLVGNQSNRQLPAKSKRRTAG